jgi:catechol 2,3-dioxygenase
MSKINQRSTSAPFKIAPSMRIGHVSLNVFNLERSLDFYQKILGFKVVAKSGEKAILSAAGEDSPSYLVELLQAKANPNRDMFDPSASSNRAGLYHFAILLPERKYLADMLLNLGDNRDRVHFDGFADHLVSESIYIRDPDFNGIEIYRDRPVSEWNWNGDQIEMATLPLNTDDLVREATDKGWREMPPKTTIGHVHLHVCDIPKAMSFYRDILGLNLTATIPSAAFFAADSYHHHIATNTWLGIDILPASPQSIGLNHFSIVLPSKEEFERLVKQLSRYNMDMTALSGRSGFTYDIDGIKIQVQHE